jgi:glycosyltransferase involved in cell wall biosynthesis
MTRTLTIVTPTRNAAEYLVETIESVRAQSRPDLRIEHLFVDSGSTDGTLEILEEHGCQVIHVPPINVNHSTNVGMRAASGEAIGFLGGDDLLMPGAADYVADWLTWRKREWLVGALHWTDASSHSIGLWRPPPSWMKTEMYASLGWSCMPAQATWFTPKFFAEMTGFPEDFEHIGDYYFFSRALQHSPFDRTTRPLATFRRHGKNMSITAGDARLIELERIQKEFAPASPMKRAYFRYLLKVSTNAANPSWALHKKVGPIMPRRKVP